MQTIIHIGAGHCNELEAYLASNAQRILLIEPIPALAAKLAKQAQAHRNVAVREAAITADPAHNQLQEYNLQDASSLRAATGLKRLFPGLKTLRTHSVQTLTPEQLLGEIALEPGQPAKLVIQAPGEEQAILQALIASDQLKAFSHLNLTANPEPFYEGSVAAEASLAMLADYGYIMIDHNQQDPDWPSWELQRNPLKDRITELESQNRQLKSQQTQAAKDLEAARNAAEQTTQALAAKEQAEKEARQQLEQLSARQAEQQRSFEQQQLSFEQQQSSLEQQQRELQALKEELEKTNKSKAQADQARQALQTELNDVKASTAKQLEQVTKAAEERAAALEIVQKELDDHKGWLAKRKKQVQELEQQLQQMATARQQLEQENTRLKAQLQTLEQDKRHLQESQNTGQQAFTQLEAKMEQLFNQHAARQSSELQQATNALGKHVTQSFQVQRQQIQAITGLHQYLESGEQPLEYGGWAIGADLAGHLVRAIETNQYDLIIEFGSGTSTVLLARAVLNTISSGSRSVGTQALEHTGRKEVVGSQQVQSLDEYDLPQRILSFEQDRAFLQQTQNSLASSNLNQLVDLVLAPLVPTTRTAQAAHQALFYDCEQNLARIAQLYAGRSAKILVLVDGPHSPQANPLAREPALATLLQYLSAHQLHLVLDDANREGEQQVARLWQQVCEQRGLTCQQRALNTEKGALWLTIND